MGKKQEWNQERKNEQKKERKEERTNERKIERKEERKNQMSCALPGVLFAGARLYPPASGSLWDSAAGAEGRTAELHW